MSCIIEKLAPKNYEKCNNIWDMSKKPEMAKVWHDELVAGNRVIFVYIENGEYLGEGSLVFENGDPDYTIKNQRIYLSRMIVKEECRNRGIGTKILEFMFNYAKDLGYKEMSLGVDIGNIGARWLYESNGFTNVIFTGEDEVGKFVKLIKSL